MTSLQYQSSPQALPRTAVQGAASDRTFWQDFAATGVSYFKWAYGGTFLLGIAYYVFRLFQSLWISGNFAGFAGACALLAGAIYGVYRLWMARRTRISSAAYVKQTK